MTDVTLKQLRYFDAVARLGHFGRAAEVCSISQPAISLQIKELEGALGAVLFERRARGIRLTGVGEDLVPRARAILRSVEDLSDLSRAPLGGLVGKLRLGIIPTIAPYLLPQVIGRLALSHPTLELRIRETQTEKLILDLLDGRLDAAIVALPVSEPALVEIPLFEEKFVLVRSKEDGKKPVPDRASLREMRLLLLEEGHCFRDQALSFCSSGSALPREGMEGSSLSTLVQMVGAGIGVTLIPEMAVAVETRSADVCVDYFRAPQPSRKIGMVWRRTSPLNTQFTRISEEVGKAGGKLGKSDDVSI
jgi:LysR family hydrogen peroxide-inducible transcriptional activator